MEIGRVFVGLIEIPKYLGILIILKSKFLTIILSFYFTKISLFTNSKKRDFKEF